MKFHLRLQQFNQNVDFDPLLKICKIVKIYFLKWSLFAECFNFYIYDYPEISGSKLNLLVRDGFRNITLTMIFIYLFVVITRFSCSLHHVENLRH